MAGVFHIINSNDLPDRRSVSARIPEDLVDKLQREANNSVKWLKENRLCVAGDNEDIIEERVRNCWL